VKASTQFKIRCARFIHKILRRVGVPQRQVIQRNNIYFEVDLSEGIDMSLYLFGVFQRHILGNKYFALPRNGVIIDVGANIGSMTLPFATQVSEGRVFAIEPTDYALKKLRRNIELNGILASRIEIIPAFVSSKEALHSELTAYASWKLDGRVVNAHPVHMGQIKESSAPQTTIDAIVDRFKLPMLHLVKIDTDGHELEVLEGARDTLQRHKPVVIFELSTYLLKERGRSFDEYERLLKPLGYILRDSETGRIVTAQNIEGLVPPMGSIDVIATP
jgi:FkbM family methyltransferase